MNEARHQINWAMLVAQGRAKAHGVMWTEEEARKLAGKEATVEGLREADNIARLKKAVAKAPAKKAPAKKAVVVPEKVEENEG